MPSFDSDLPDAPAVRTRRRYQHGCIIDDGWRWIFRWREDVAHPATGCVKRVRRWSALTKKECPTKRLAQRELDRILEPINSLSYRGTVGGVTFARFAEKWTAEVMCHHKPSSQDSERTILRKHLLPAFGQLPLSSITAEMIQEFVNGWQQSPKTLRNVIIVLMGMWDTAMGWNYVNHSPFPRRMNGRLLLRMPRMVQGKTYNFSLEEALSIIDKAEGKYKLLFRTFAETGARPGELCGMRRTDLNGRVLSLTQAVYRTTVQTQKTVNAVRQFAISSRLADDLREYIEQTKNEPNNFGLVWTNSVGNPLPMNKVIFEVLNPILDGLGIGPKLDQLGVRKCGLYGFRRMNATELSRAGVPLKTIQKRIGHAIGSNITEKHYIKPVDADDLAAADMLGEMLSLKRSGETVQ